MQIEKPKLTYIDGIQYVILKDYQAKLTYLNDQRAKGIKLVRAKVKDTHGFTVIKKGDIRYVQTGSRRGNKSLFTIPFDKYISNDRPHYRTYCVTMEYLLNKMVDLVVEDIELLVSVEEAEKALKELEAK